MIYRKDIYCASTTFNAYPIIGHPHFIGILQGMAIVTVVPPDVVTAHSDLDAFLKDCGSGTFADAHATILKEGEALWIPRGFCPLVYGVENNKTWTDPVPTLVQKGMARKKDKKKPDGSIEFFAVPCYDTAMAAQAEKKVRLGVASMWPRASEFLPKVSVCNPGWKVYTPVLTPC